MALVDKHSPHTAPLRPFAVHAGRTDQFAAVECAKDETHVAARLEPLGVKLARLGAMLVGSLAKRLRLRLQCKEPEPRKFSRVVFAELPDMRQEPSLQPHDLYSSIGLLALGCFVRCGR